MTHNEVFGKALWICTDGSPDAAFFRSEFEIEHIMPAEIIICGLGYFELYINGTRVGNDYFVPANSDFHERPNMTLAYPLNDSWTHRIYCMKYDVTKYLTKGKNAIGIIVGSGFYHQVVRKGEGNVSYGDIKLCYSLKIGEREIVSDENVKYSYGFFRSSNLFYGEELDYTGFNRKWNTVHTDENGWKNVSIAETPKSEYYIQNCPTDKIAETLEVEFIKDFGEYSVYKIPKNISGYPVIRCDKAGQKVVMECTEEIFDDMNLNNRSVGYGKQRQIEVFITDGVKEEYHPYFCWFGFRYFSLTNNAKPVCVKVIHSDVSVTSDFFCSDETLNWYYKTFINTQLCNMHGGVPSDCPHRERLGYTGDGQLCCDAVMTEIDSQSFYRKWIDDIWDCQDRFTGHVQHTAPFAGGGGGPAGWGGAIIVVPYTFYRHYADKKLLEYIYPRMELFVDYIQSRCVDGLIVSEEKGGWCLGDWCTPEKVKIPEPFVNTTLFINQLQMMAYCAEVLGLDSSRYKDMIKVHSHAVKKKYYNEQTESFLEGLQGADGFAVSSGIADKKTEKVLNSKYSALNEFDTGIFGTYELINALYKSGNVNTATELLANKNDVSFETMRRAGATTLWEYWNGKASHSHPMFGASTKYLFEYILGIRQTEKSASYDEVIISPVFANILDFAKGYITTPHGKISVEWRKIDGKTEVDIDICKGTKAVFIHDDTNVKLNTGHNTFCL